MAFNERISLILGLKSLHLHYNRRLHCAKKQCESESHQDQSQESFCLSFLETKEARRFLCLYLRVHPYPRLSFLVMVSCKR